MLDVGVRFSKCVGFVVDVVVVSGRSCRGCAVCCGVCFGCGSLTLLLNLGGFLYAFYMGNLGCIVRFDSSLKMKKRCCEKFYRFHL